MGPLRCIKILKNYYPVMWCHPRSMDASLVHNCLSDTIPRKNTTGHALLYVNLDISFAGLGSVTS